MARASGQKLKLLYLAKILMEETDEGHAISTQELPCPHYQNADGLHIDPYGLSLLNTTNSAERNAVCT